MISLRDADLLTSHSGVSRPMTVLTQPLDVRAFADTAIPSGTVDRAMCLIDALRSHGEPINLTDLSRRTGLAKSTTHRLVNKLLSRGFVTHSELGYSAALYPATAQRAATTSRGLRRILAPLVSELYVCLRRTVGLAFLTDDDVVFIERVHAPGSVWTTVDDHRRAPAMSTAAGRLLLAFEQQAPSGSGPSDGVSSTGFGWVRPGPEFGQIRQARRCRHESTTTPGVACLAVPVIGGYDRIGAALVVTSTAGDIDATRMIGTLNAFAVKAGSLMRRTPVDWAAAA